MWQEGFVDEVVHLEKLGLRDGVTACKALGYAQVLDALDGTISMEQAIEDTVVATRRFAKRQDSWFGRDDSILWLDAETASVQSVLSLE
jgi:tRNA dimethylallyltransferase